MQVGNHSYAALQAVDLPWSVATNVTIGCPTCTGWDYYSALGEGGVTAVTVAQLLLRTRLRQPLASMPALIPCRRACY